MIKAIITKGGLIIGGAGIAVAGWALNEAGYIGGGLAALVSIVGLFIVIGTCLTIREGERVVEHGDVHAHNSEH
jgi:hypothetical protein